MQVNGKQLDLDIFELNTAERFENAVKEVAKQMQEMKEKELSLADSIRLQCEAIADCFDALWGEGAAYRIFDGRVNLKLALQSFEDLMKGAAAQKEDMKLLVRSFEDTRLHGETEES